MRSLFNDSCCGGVSPTTECKGCVCDVLNKAANGRCNDILSNTETVVNLLPKGEDDYLNLYGSSHRPTPFTLVSFDPKTCCGKFTYPYGSGRSTRTIILDCRCLCGISPVPQD